MIKYFLIPAITLFACFPAQGQEKEVYLEGYDRLRYSIERIVVSPGTRVELTFKTVSSLPKSQMAHNWVLLKGEADVEEFVHSSEQHEKNEYVDPERTGDIIAATGMLGGGEQETITFTAPLEKGEYSYVCTFPAHYAAGMKGILVVE